MFAKRHRLSVIPFACVGIGVLVYVLYSISLRVGPVFEDMRGSFLQALNNVDMTRVTSNGMVVSRFNDIYLYQAAPVKSKWTEVTRVEMEEDVFYPVYYTNDGYQVLRRNPRNGLFAVHALLDGNSTFFYFDTGANLTVISDPDLLAKIRPPCMMRMKANTASDRISTCYSEFKELNIDGLVLKGDGTPHSFYDGFNFQQPLDEQVEADGERHAFSNLLGMSTINEFDFVIKNDLLFIRPSKTSRAKMGDKLVRMVSLLNSKVKR